MPMQMFQQRQWVRVFATLVMVALVVGAVFGFYRFLHWDAPGIVLAGAYDQAVRIRLSFSAALRAYHGDDPVPGLLSENELLKTDTAQLHELQEENAFLRKISDLPARRERTVIDAGVFAYSMSASGARLVMNRGALDGIVTGAPVTTESGILIGLVASVQDHTSTVHVVGAAGIQVTGRVRGTEVNGLVRLDVYGELVLDLVAKDEPVTEGYTVETSGLDEVPAGLLIGSVRTVDADRTTLFQVIRLDAAHRSQPIRRVLVLNP